MSEKQRNTEKWKKVVSLRAAGFTFQQIADWNGISRQRAHEILGQARLYAEANKDPLAVWIQGKMGMTNGNK